MPLWDDFLVLQAWITKNFVRLSYIEKWILTNCRSSSYQRLTKLIFIYLHHGVHCFAIITFFFMCAERILGSFCRQDKIDYILILQRLVMSSKCKPTSRASIYAKKIISACMRMTFIISLRWHCQSVVSFFYYWKQKCTRIFILLINKL